VAQWTFGRGLGGTYAAAALFMGARFGTWRSPPGILPALCCRATENFFHNGFIFSFPLSLTIDASDVCRWRFRLRSTALTVPPQHLRQRAASPLPAANTANAATCTARAALFPRAAGTRCAGMQRRAAFRRRCPPFYHCCSISLAAACELFCLRNVPSFLHRFHAGRLRHAYCSHAATGERRAARTLPFLLFGVVGAFAGLPRLVVVHSTTFFALYHIAFFRFGAALCL
jgi:hypothetical protein